MPSFDIVSKVNMAEITNVVAGVMREVGTRYDFKGSQCDITLEEDKMTLLADDDLKLKQMHELLKGYCVRRGVEPASLDFGKEEAASQNKVRQVVRLKEGIDKELAKTITKSIKDSKMKVQVSIQGDELRVTGKKRDDLQEAIAFVKSLNIEQPLQFQNFRD